MRKALDHGASTAFALKREDIVHILGEVSDGTVMAILASNGSYADLELAYACAMGDDRQEGQLGPLAGAAARIYDILQDDPAFAPAEQR
jgi:hypothetical protein